MKLTVDLISKTNKSKTFLVKFKKDNLINDIPSKVSYEVLVYNDTLEFKYDKKELKKCYHFSPVIQVTHTKE